MSKLNKQRGYLDVPYLGFMMVLAVVGLVSLGAAIGFLIWYALQHLHWI